MIYHHPLAYLLGMEGLALLRAWAGDYDEAFVTDRLAEVRRLLDDEVLAGHPGVRVRRNATTDAYRQWSTTYDDADNGLFDLDEPVLHTILDRLPVGTALDAACGTGRLSTLLAAHGHRVIGVDGSADMLHRARGRAPVGVVQGDLHRLPLADAAVDLVVNGLALTHVPELGPVLAELGRVLRPGGHLVVSDVHPELVFRGSMVTGVGPDQQPQLAATYRHSVGDFLRTALDLGFTVRHFEELPRPAEPTEPVPDPTPTAEMGAWETWPWTLLGLVPAATRAAWNQPAVVIWHLQRPLTG